MGKSTLTKWPCSIANCKTFYQRVDIEQSARLGGGGNCLVLLIFCSWPHGPVAVRSLLTEIGVDLEEKPPNWRSSHRNPVFFLNFLTGGY